MKKQGKFITIEGIEGAGKSTAVRFVEQYLQKQGIEYVLTREPGGTKVAENIRQLLLNHNIEPISPNTELLLMFASRAQHLAIVIEPALKKNNWVICDRFTDASYAYQGGGRNISEQRIAVLENWVQGDLRPDLTIILDVRPEVGLMRAKQVSTPDRFETEEIEFFHRVRNSYLQRARKHPTRYAVVDAEQDIDSVKRSIIDILGRYEY